MLEALTGEASAELVARHWAAAGEVERAVPLWLAAVDAAHARGAYEEAAEHARQAATAIRELGEESPRLCQAATMWGRSLHLSGRRTEALKVFEGHIGLAEKIGHDPSVGELYLHGGFVYAFLGQRAPAQEMLEKGLHVAESLGDERLILRARQALTAEAIFRGDLRHAVAESAKIVRTTPPGRRLISQRGATFESALMIAAWAHLSHGDAIRAKQLGEHGLAEARAARDRYQESHAAWVLGGSHTLLGEWHCATRVLEEGLEIAPPFGAAIVHSAYSDTVRAQGDIERAIPLLEESMERTRRYRSMQVQAKTGLNLAR